MWRDTHTHTDTATNSQTGGCSHADTKKTGKMRDAYPSHTHPFSSLHPSHCCPLSHIICSFPLKTPWTYGPLKPAVSLSANTQTPTHSHQPFPIHGVGQQVYWILMISGPASPWLISGCRFSVVYLILSFCLHPFIISPRLPAFVRNEGGHLPSMPPSPSSLSSQTTVVASVRLWKGKTLFACASVHICVAMCV